MKHTIKQSVLNTVRCAYAYPQGIFVLLHEKRDAQAGTVTWATIHKTDIRTPESGRLVIHSCGALRACLMAERITYKAPKLEYGSENSKQAGIAVGYVSLLLGSRAYDDELRFNIFENFISSDFTPQPDCRDGPPALDATRWGDYHVAH